MARSRGADGNDFKIWKINVNTGLVQRESGLKFIPEDARIGKLKFFDAQLVHKLTA
jgi:hypothetical protein